jgi:hypothetical protein
MLAIMVCSEEFRAKTNVGNSVAIELPLKYDAVNACDEVIAYDADIAYDAVPSRDPVIPFSTISDPDTSVLPLIIVVEPLTTVDPKLGAGE